MPPVFIALFFFIVNIATLGKLTQNYGPDFDYEAFQMPTAILLGVTGVSRAGAMVLDVRGNPGGYIWAAELALQLPVLVQEDPHVVLPVDDLPQQ